MSDIVCAAVGNEQAEGLKRALLVMKIKFLSGHAGILASGEKAGTLTYELGHCRTVLLPQEIGLIPFCLLPFCLLSFPHFFNDRVILHGDAFRVSNRGAGKV